MTRRRIDDAMLERAARDGYCVVRGLCDADRVASLRARVERDLAERSGPLELESQVGYPGAPRPDAPGGETVRRLLDALGRDPIFGAWACDPKLIEIIRALLGTPDVRVVRAHHNCIMTKLPAFSSATGWHQDLRYWSFERPELVNAWTALGQETEGNGGMRVIPGSHRAALPQNGFDAQRFFRDDLAENRPWLDRAVQVDLAPGDVLFFHAGLLHAAGSNRTAERKFSVVFSYRAADNRPQPGSRSAAREDIDPAAFATRAAEARPCD